MDLSNKVVVTCAITGVLTNPGKFNVPVTPEEMAEATRLMMGIAEVTGGKYVHVTKP